jgi:cytosine/adenosine deaminase-related metal-dependent hydrolase
MFDLSTSHLILKGRVLTCVSDQAIEAGFVEIDGDKIKAVGRVADLGQTDAEVIETRGTILPGLFSRSSSPVHK